MSIDIRKDYGRNYIINGGFDFWQRGTSVNNTDNAYLADRFFYGSDNIQVNLARVADVPSYSTSQYSLSVERTVAAGASSASQVSYVRYIVEGNDYADLHNRLVTISFSVKSSITGPQTLNLTRGTDFGRRRLIRYTINQPNVWEKKTIRVKLDDQSGWAFDNQQGLQIFWVLAAGSSFLGTDDSNWINGSSSDNWALSDQTQFAESSAQTFQLSDVQVVLGPQDIPFRRAGSSWAEELRMCERYYEKSYGLDFFPGDTTSNGLVDRRQTATTTSCFFGIELRVRKRAVPTVTTYSSVTGTSGVIRNSSTASDQAVTIFFVGETSYGVQTVSAQTANSEMNWQHVVNAEY